MKLKLLPLLSFILLAAPTTRAEQVVVTAFFDGGFLFTGGIPVRDVVLRGSLQGLSSNFQSALGDVENQLQDLSDQLEKISDDIDRLSERLNEVAALNAALDFQRPAPGKSHRVFTGFGQFQDKTAVGIGITGVYKNFDYGVGASFSANQMLTKGSVGWSF